MTLRAPPPLEQPLIVERDGDGIRIVDGEILVAEAVPATIELEVPAAPSFEQAETASARYPGLQEHAFPRCFICGPEREPGDGLRIFAGPLGDGRFAATWQPSEVRPELVWAALDCPGAIAVGFPIAARRSSAGSPSTSRSCPSPESAASFSRGRSARRDGSSTRRRRCTERPAGLSRGAAPRGSLLTPEPDRVEVVLDDLARAPDQVLDVVVLRVDIAPASASALPDARTWTSCGASSGGVHAASSGAQLVMLGLHHPRTDDEHRDPPPQLVRERLAVPARRQPCWSGTACCSHRAGTTPRFR